MGPEATSQSAPLGLPDGPVFPSEPINLRDARRRRGLSLRAAAAEIGVSPMVIVRAEEGKQPLAQNALAIADFYGLDVIVQWPDPEDPAA